MTIIMSYLEVKWYSSYDDKARPSDCGRGVVAFSYCTVTVHAHQKSLNASELRIVGFENLFSLSSRNVSPGDTFMTRALRESSGGWP